MLDYAILEKMIMNFINIIIDLKNFIIIMLITIIFIILFIKNFKIKSLRSVSHMLWVVLQNEITNHIIIKIFICNYILFPTAIIITMDY